MAGEVRKFTRQEVAARDTKASNTFIIDNYVYDVAQFLDEHPGGHEVLVNAAGKDASEDFEDIGHSLDAKDLMKKYRIGELVDEDKKQAKKSAQVNWHPSATAAAEPGFVGSWKFPVVLGILATVLYSYLFG
ncbi:cytochrome b5 [Ostrinia furnacalis]|uniref:cytochrome b5 n=1 Tax=Ostrinia furnacalis TaxID=93504 RepID=UPI00103D0235|nr:cytochrome b5 [Ostrinia furnacalis]